MNGEEIINIVNRKQLLLERYINICLNENETDRKEAENILAELRSISETLSQNGMIEIPNDYDELERFFNSWHGDSTEPRETNPQRILKPSEDVK